MTTVTEYVYSRQSEGPYSNGKKQLNGKLDIPILAVRVSHFTTMGALTFSPMIVFSWARVDAAPAALNSLLGKNAKGMGDLRVGGTLWLLDDRQKREFVGISGTLIIPTGQYDPSSLINIGGNRTVLVINGGWLKPLNSRLSFELLPEIALYAPNHRYANGNEMRQAPTYALTGTLSYHLSPFLQIFTNAQINRGGTMSINGEPQNNPAENSRFSFGAGYSTGNGSQWMVRYSRDLTVTHGFKTTNELAVRYLVYF